MSKEANDYYNNHLNKLICAAERTYYTDFFRTCCDNIERTWFGIQTLMGNIKAKYCLPTCLNINETLIEDEKELSNEVHRFFSVL